MSGRPVPRPTARVLLVSPEDRLLLFSAKADRGTSRIWWFTPGGGVRRGESLAQAAVRELAEETGHVIAEDCLGPVVAVSSGTWTAGRTVFQATDSFFLVRAAHTAVDTSRHEALERSVITGHRWWPVDELDATPDLIAPAGLAGLMRRLLADGPPAEPLALPWR